MSNFTVIEDNQKKKRVDVSGDNVLQALKQSSLPNQAMEALGTTVVASNRVDDGAAAAYAASRNSRNDALRRGHLEINSAEITNTNQGTLARHINHELGHLAENLTRGEIGQNIEPRVSDKEWLEHSNYASASGEGFADGIALRFGSAPQDSSFPPNSVNDPNNHGLVGYKPENWSNPQNQVAYTAHRAHAWSTGELPTGSLPERIHTMGANPAVRDALRQVEQRQRLNHVSRSPHNPPESSGPVFDQDTQVHGPDRRLSGYVPITDVAKNLSQQFMNTRKTGRQLSLLGEQNEYDTYDVDKVDWDS
jgi:hypothetical protein